MTDGYDRHMLVLFDIDGTLLISSGAGRDAMVEAGRHLVGEHFSLDGVEIAGRLDPLIWADASTAHRIDSTVVSHDKFRETYAAALASRFERDPCATLLPGVAALVERRGLELGASLRISEHVHLRTAYTLLDARYRDFDTFSGGQPIDHDGNREPNLPRHNLTAELRMESESGLFAVLAVHHRSSFPVNDQNDLDADALEQYDILLEEQAYPFEEKAIELFRVNTDRAADGVYDEWVRKSFEAMASLMPGRYAKLERSEDVVTALF